MVMGRGLSIPTIVGGLLANFSEKRTNLVVVVNFSIQELQLVNMTME
jgi:hypothetical protein